MCPEDVNLEAKNLANLRAIGSSWFKCARVSESPILHRKPKPQSKDDSYGLFCEALPHRIARPIERRDP